MRSLKDATPLLYPGVMVSSTFADLEAHRAMLEEAIDGEQLKAVMMEHDTAKSDVDVLESSLQMVRDSSAYIAVIGHTYGQIPNSPGRNPGGRSLTELEFDEAMRLERPVLLFIMGRKHPVTIDGIEHDLDRRQKLHAFRERAKLMRDDSQVHRVYQTFESLEEFGRAAARAVAGLRRVLDARADVVSRLPPTQPRAASIPQAPAFYAEPPYIGSHRFVGRADQLSTLDEWAAASDGNPILLFEAIGGSGKSMLTWEWATLHAQKIRPDFCGRFWYSFYEKGAVMADFCQCALAYTTGHPRKDFQQLKTPELAKMLVLELRQRPWLFVLDGLERVLVSYHRFDAAQLRDEEVGAPDLIAKRDPSSAIRTEDDDLLLALGAASPSKLLLTTRLTPRVLLNRSHQAIPGVRRELLPGLRPSDAERMLRSCGVSGDSKAIQSYLKIHCDCHPLTTGIIAGLINNYLPARGDFDIWAASPNGGGRLNLADLDLVQKRNHILRAAINDLSAASRHLLAMLALLPGSADYETLCALNPHLPAAPPDVRKPQSLESVLADSTAMDGEPLEQVAARHRLAMDRWQDNQRQREAIRNSDAFRAGPRDLADTVFDLEARGLLQYDRQARRYDLHPVVRGFAADGLEAADREQYGQRVVDYFSQRAHDPWREAQTLDDLSVGLTLVRTLLRIGRLQDAFDAYYGDLSGALKKNLGAFNEILSLLRPFLNRGLTALPDCVSEEASVAVAEDFAGALYASGNEDNSMALVEPLILRDLERKDWFGLANRLGNAAYVLRALNRLASAHRVTSLSMDLAVAADIRVDIFRRHLDVLSLAVVFGNWDDAESAWQQVETMGRSWPRDEYSPGRAEVKYAEYRLRRGDLCEDLLVTAEALARSGKSQRIEVKNVHELRALWYVERGEWGPLAAEARELVRMEREVGDESRKWEPLLTLALMKLGQLENPRREIDRLPEGVDDLTVGQLWLALGEREKALERALSAYRHAWADGEPYVRRHGLNQARALLEELGATVPNLPPYNSARERKFPWEDSVAHAIDRLKQKPQPKRPGQ